VSVAAGRRRTQVPSCVTRRPASSSVASAGTSRRT
jgi:hypothetical protein